jgi:hypothetical protein
LLKAQAHYIGAKIAFLQKRSGVLEFHLLAYLSLLAASKLRPTAGGALADKA